MSASTVVDAPQTAHGDELQSLRSALAQARAELAAAQEARVRAETTVSVKDEFLAEVSHELRGTLGAILGWAHMLRSGGTEADVAHGLEVIEQSAEVQSRLIEDLLDMSRIAAHRLRLDMAPVQLSAVVEAAVNAARPVANGKRIALRANLDAPVGAVRGDATRLRQVVGNLLTNAVKFTPDGGRIDVALRASSGFAVLTVRDSGIGIAPAFVPHVFERFSQDVHAAKGQNGLGLGLAIVRSLVELHGGDIAVQSEGEGRGATFTVRLPIA